jgi:hypothetical protein
MQDRDEIDITGIFRNMERSAENAMKLTKLAAEIKERIGEAPIHYDELGNFSVHPDLMAEIERPENEGLYEYLLYLQKRKVFAVHNAEGCKYE